MLEYKNITPNHHRNFKVFGVVAAHGSIPTRCSFKIKI